MTKLKILCLHGVGTNEDFMRLRLAPLIHTLDQQENLASFHFVPGTIEVVHNEGQSQDQLRNEEGEKLATTAIPTVDSELRAVKQLMAILPPGPYLRYLDYRPRKRRGIRETSTDNATGINDSLSGSSSSITYLPTASSMASALERLERIIEQDGPFDGLMGHSEGSCVAATLLSRHMERSHRSGADGSSDGCPPPFRWRCAIFFNGGPPYTEEEAEAGGVDDEKNRHCVDEKVLLPADPDCPRDQVLIPIPSCHVMSVRDPANDRAVALYKLCATENANIVEHGKGHMIPNAPKVLERVAKFVRMVISGDISPMTSKSGEVEGASIKT